MESWLTSPHLPTTSLISFLPNERSTIHLLTALLLLSGVRSSSAIRTHPRDWTANRTGFSWGSVFFDSNCNSWFAVLCLKKQQPGIEINYLNFELQVLCKYNNKIRLVHLWNRHWMMSSIHTLTYFGVI